MNLFRCFLVTAWLVLMGYTAVVIADHGTDLVSVFFGDMAAVAWPGQFNLDFTMLLCLSAIWVSWRHRFSAGGLLLGATALFGGSAFLLVYLLVVSLQAKGDARVVLIGSRA